MKCPFCFGRGDEIVSDFLFGDQVTHCPDCNGTGEIPDEDPQLQPTPVHHPEE